MGTGVDWNRNEKTGRSRNRANDNEWRHTNKHEREAGHTRSQDEPGQWMKQIKWGRHQNRGTRKLGSGTNFAVNQNPVWFKI